MGEFSAKRRRDLGNWGVNGVRLSVVVNFGRVRRRLEAGVSVGSGRV